MVNYTFIYIAQCPANRACIVLYCIVLYCIVLYCIVLYCIDQVSGIVVVTRQRSKFRLICKCLDNVGYQMKLFGMIEFLNEFHANILSFSCFRNQITTIKFEWIIRIDTFILLAESVQQCHA